MIATPEHKHLIEYTYQESPEPAQVEIQTEDATGELTWVKAQTKDEALALVKSAGANVIRVRVGGLNPDEIEVVLNFYNTPDRQVESFQPTNSPWFRKWVSQYRLSIGKLVRATYCGDKPHLDKRGALIRRNPAPGDSVLAQFNDRDLEEAFGWHPFPRSHFKDIGE